MNVIKCNMAGKQLELNIEKFKAIESLDFILNLINYLPVQITLPEDIILEKNTIKYIIMFLMDVGDNVEIADQQKEVLNNLKDLNLIKIIFKEAYLNVDNETRAFIRSKLFSLLTYNDRPLNADIDNYLRTPKQLFNALLQIMEYNYNDFFLM